MCRKYCKQYTESEQEEHRIPMPHFNPLISVCIPTYNRAKSLGRAIESVLSQTYENFELIISDNDSNDNTADIVAMFNDIRIRFVKQSTNLGMAGNWNACIKMARGEFIAFLSSDDYWEGICLEVLAAEFLGEQSLGIVFGNLCLDDGSSRWQRRRLVADGIVKDLRKEIIIHNPISINASIIRRQCFVKVGAFADLLTADYDWWLRFSKTKWRAMYRHRLVTVYTIHPEALSSNKKAMWLDTIRALENHSFGGRTEKARRRLLYRLCIRVLAYSDDNRAELIVNEVVAKYNFQLVWLVRSTFAKKVIVLAVHGTDRIRHLFNHFRSQRGPATC